jgi:VanZ family protein
VRIAANVVVAAAIARRAEAPRRSAGIIDHFLAYALSAFVLSMGWPGQAVSITVGLFGVGGISEAAQIWVPGRHAELATVLTNGVGAFVGAAIGHATLLSARAARSQRER